MDIKFHHISVLLDDRSMRKQFEGMDVNLSGKEIVGNILAHKRDGMMVLAYEDDLLVGCYCFNPVSDKTNCNPYDLPLELGDDCSLMFPHSPYTRPSHRRRGIANALRDAAYKRASELGFTHAIIFMHKTQEVRDWGFSKAGWFELNAKDKFGGTMYAREL